VFFTVMVTLTVTGYLLYYVGSDPVRDVLAIAHWGVGLGLPLLTIWHVWRGRVWRRLRLTEQRSALGNVVRSANPSADSERQRRAGGASG
ncbi:MAG: hypothetical protein GTO41_13585, partial [Burkholderiales bacterium]|nr:hypothetical protein [Burkholderiales bacterium]